MSYIKRISIALIAFLLIFGLFYGGYRLYESRKPVASASCFDNIQNQNETERDCGGVCKSCETIKELTLFDAKAIPTKQGFVDLFAELRNTNLDYGVPSLLYTFELFDKDNGSLGKKEGVAFILPNSTKFIIEQAISAKDRVSRVKFTFQDPKFQEVKNFVKPRLSALNVTFDQADSGFLRARGGIINQSNANFNKVNAVFVLRDDANRLIAVNAHEVQSLASNENRFFEIEWAYRTAFFSHFDAQIDTNIFDEANIFQLR